MQGAGFEETCRLKDFDWSAPITLGSPAAGRRFLLGVPRQARARTAGGTGRVGKSFLAQALGYAAIRAGHTVRFSHADDLFKAMSQARVDNSVDRTFRSLPVPRPADPDDLGLHRLTAQQSADLYELILNRHRSSASSSPATGSWTNG